LDYEGFIFVVEHICSDIFLYLLIFLFEKRPFSKMSLKRFGNLSFNNKGAKNYYTPEPIPSKKIISPNLHSKFSPSITLTKTPYIRQKFGMADIATKEESKNLLLKYASKQWDGTREITISPVAFVTRKKKTSLTAFKFSQIIESDGIGSASPVKTKSKEYHTNTSKGLKSLSNENKE
jgi:hypothetical protein